MPKAMKSEGIFRKPGSKKYHMAFRVNSGKVVNRSTRMVTKGAALKVFLATKEREIKKDLNIHSDKTVREVHKVWEEMAVTEFGEKYVRAVKADLKRHWNHLLDKRVCDITQEDIAAVQNDIKSLGFQPESTNKAINAFSCIFTYARNELGWFPFMVFKFSREKVTRKPRTGLTKAQAPIFLQLVAASGNIQATMIIAMMLGLALREVEARYACWSRFRYGPDGRLIYIALGKNDKDRPIAVPQWLEFILLGYQEYLASPEYRPSRRAGRPRTQGPQGHRPGNSGTTASKATDWMFAGPSGRPRSQGFTAPYVRKAAETLKIKGLSPHRLRGTAANLLKLEGLSLDELKNLLGHLHIETTSLYLEPSITEARSAQDSLGEKIWPGVSDLLKEKRARLSLGADMLLPLPPEALGELAENLKSVETPAMQLLPRGGSPAEKLGQTTIPPDPAAELSGLTTAIQGVSLSQGKARPPRELLAQLVWELPTVRIADIYEVSDSILARWCKEWGIEKPERGYWAKVNALVAPLREASARNAPPLCPDTQV